MKVGDKVLLKVPSDYIMRPYYVPAVWLHEISENSTMSTSSKTYILDRALFEDDIHIELNTNS